MHGAHLFDSCVTSFCILIYGKVKSLCVEYEYSHRHKYVTCYNVPMHVIQFVNTLLK